MPDHREITKLEWRDDVIPIATRFDDPYYSIHNGLEETRHVFLSGNDLPERFEDGFHIAELGFGTGLNFLTTLLAWRAAGAKGAFHFTSFEAFPLAPADMERALSHFAELADVAPAFLAAYEKGYDIELEGAHLRIILGDARETLPSWDGAANAWFLDGFSPAKNPELWDEALMGEVAHHTRKGGSFATYTAAGFVRRGLEGAGFAVERKAGFGRKRHMITGKLKEALA